MIKLMINDTVMEMDQSYVHRYNVSYNFIIQ